MELKNNNKDSESVKINKIWIRKLPKKVTEMIFEAYPSLILNVHSIFL